LARFDSKLASNKRYVTLNIGRSLRRPYSGRPAVRIDVSHTGIHFVLLKIQEIALRLEGRYLHRHRAQQGRTCPLLSWAAQLK
jgi:hypothetical protein